MIDDFIDRKHGRKKIEYELPELKEILEETLGVIVYQEQVMQIANRLAGYSLGEADLLRRAMGKKQAEEMAKQRERFVEGATQRSFPPKKIEKIFDLMAQFAGYGFNKSHSAAYALLAYHTAYLKTHYPVEFMTATAGPGISLMSEFAGLAYYAEVPAVVWDIQRVGPSTGLPTRTSQGDILSTAFLSHGDTKHILLIPSSVSECFDMAQDAFNLAEQYQTLVFVMSDLDLGMRISQLVFERELKARREPSGEIRGDSEIDPICVIACWFAPS